MFYIFSQKKKKKKRERESERERDTKLTLKGKSVKTEALRRSGGINLTQIIAFLYRGNSVFSLKVILKVE